MEWPKTYLTIAEFNEYFPLGEQISSQEANLAIQEAQIIINSWLDYNPLPTEYQEIITSNSNGVVLLSNYPVIQIDAVIAQPLLGQEINYTERELVLIWRERDRALYTTMRNCPIKIRYFAGYDPLPDEYKLAFIKLLKTCWQNNQFNFQDIYSPIKDVSSISIGGLSQSFRLGGGASAQENTQLDRILQTLKKRRIIT